MTTRVIVKVSVCKEMKHMDDMQKAICDAFRQNPDIIGDRQRLKSALADIIPTEKLMQNIILDAYDEDVVSKFAGNNEIAMQALKLNRDLVDGYGLTDESATWSVSTWCYMLGHDEVAVLLGNKKPQTSSSNHNSGNKGKQSRSEYLFGSMYKAGSDFPAGNIQIVLNGKFKKGYCAVSTYKKPNGKSRMDYLSPIVEQAYLELKEGQYLYIETIGENVSFGYKIIDLD